MILIVDDKPENVFALKSVLSLHHFTVDSAYSGEEALKKILNTSYSLIILDVQMPGMDGFEVAEAISGFNKAKDTPIIFLSAASKEKKFITKGYQSGGIDYITKPADPDILILKVKNLYKLSEQKRELITLSQTLEKEVNERIQAQTQLEKKMTELRSVMESIPQIAFSLTADGLIDYVNSGWFDYSEDKNTFPETHPDDQHILSGRDLAFSLGQEFSSEIRLRAKNEENYRYFLLRIMPVRQGDKIIKWVGTFTDIQQQKEVNELLEQEVHKRTADLTRKNEELELRNHELQQFAWVASHDLKEPLRKIQTYNSIIQDRFMADNAEAKSYLQRTIRSSEKMSELINNLLQYARLSADVSFEKTDLNLVLEQIISDLEITIGEKKATISVENLPYIEAIPTHMRQVFQNLVSNSLKFTKKDVTPVIRISGEIVAEKEFDSLPDPMGKFCRITVEDNGIGFDEKFLDRIFVIFQRLSVDVSQEGTGIGLAITKKIIDIHNGIITARSTENHGASFIIVLPLSHTANLTPAQA